MAIWIIAFEIITTIFFIIAIIRVLKKNDYRALSTMIAGAIFGVILEYLSIYFSQGYFYSQDFIFLVGKEPFNVPIMIGLAWGMLLEISHEISECFNLPIFLRTIFEATFVVSLDLFSDIVAVRLDGGYWTWTDHPAVLTITNTDFMGIAYANFYGWFLVIFLSSLVLHLFDAKYNKSNFTTLVIRTIVCIVGAEILLLGFLSLTIPLAGWVWLIFLMMYFGSIVILGIYFVKHKIHPIKGISGYFPLIYFEFLYLFNVIGMISLGLAVQIPFYFGLLILYTMGVSILLVKLTLYEEKSQMDVNAPEMTKSAP
ncbi:MAG: hypothetical protein ACTSRK_20180 [Promethearchaeota archaeon]